MRFVGKSVITQYTLVFIIYIYIDKVVQYIYVSDIEATESCIRFLDDDDDDDDEALSARAVATAGFWRTVLCDCCRPCRLAGGSGGGGGGGGGGKSSAGQYHSVHEMTASSSGQTAQSSSAAAGTCI